MPDHAKKLIQRQFGLHAAGYVSSPIHSHGYSLEQLMAHVGAQAGWRVLDVATGGGHTALALARAGAWVAAGDLTFPMLQAARTHIAGQAAGTVVFVQMDAERLPFPAGNFDAVTCRTAPHHFGDVVGFMRECARTVREGGIVAVVDQLSPPDPRAARYVNSFERLRDPSHRWAYNRAEWEGFFTNAGLVITHGEEFDTDHDLTDWAGRMGCDATTLTRLRVLLQQAPEPVAAWMKPEFSAEGAARFVIRQFLLVGRKIR